MFNVSSLKYSFLGYFSCMSGVYQNWYIGRYSKDTSSKMGYVDLIGTPREHHPKNYNLNNFLTTGPIFDLKMSLDRINE